MGDVDEMDRMDRVQAHRRAWKDFERRLTTFVTTMGDEDDEDRLVLEVGGAGEDEGLPRAVFASADEGERVEADFCGVQEFEEMGDSVGPICHRLIQILRNLRGVMHPQLLTYRASGPCAEWAGVLGISQAEDERTWTGRLPVPQSRDELHDLVGEVLEARGVESLDVDEDGDWRFGHMGQPVFVRAVEGLVAIEIFARVTHEVRSRRQAALEIAVLGRDVPWVSWRLVGRDIFQSSVVQGEVFVPQHLTRMVGEFLTTMSRTRDDLALRTGGQEG